MTTSEAAAIIAEDMRTNKAFPQWMNNMFPLIAIYYRPKKPKLRRQKIGYEVVKVEREPGKMMKIKWKPMYAPCKSKKTEQQNNYSYITCCLQAPGDFFAVSKNLRHKGYSKLISMVYATPEEVARITGAWRYRYVKYKSISEFYNHRKVDDPALLEVCDRLELDYPSKATGQLILL